MADADPADRNLLLETLGRRSFELLAPSLKRVTLRRGAIIASRTRPLTRAFFPTTSVLSLAERVGRRRVPIITVGNEGMLGHWLAVAAESLEHDVVCDVSGDAWSLPGEQLAGAARERHEIAASITEAAHDFALQLMQNVLCSTLNHTVRQRCSRTLLELRLRLGDTFELTHESLATMVSASRPSATREMHDLALRGAIDYGRGTVHVRDRAILERATCPCVGSLRARRGRLLGDAGSRPRGHDPEADDVREAPYPRNVARTAALTEG